MKNAFPSVSDFADYLGGKIGEKVKIPIMYGKYLGTTATTVSDIMNSSRGRDKICSFIQYVAEFYLACLKHSNIDEIRYLYDKGQFLSARVADSIKSSMSKGRKIFRFLEFLTEIKNIQKTIKSKKHWSFKFLLSALHILSFLYYILDNLLWGVTIGVLSELISKRKERSFKAWKNTFSLIRTIINMIKCLTILRITYRKEAYLKTELLGQPDTIIFNDGGCNSFRQCQKVLKQRRKRRFEFLDLIVSNIRFIMLMRSLKLPGYSRFHPIFVAGCGLFASMIKLFQALFQKRKALEILSLTNEENSGEKCAGKKLTRSAVSADKVSK